MTIALFEPVTRPTAAQLNAIGDDQVTLNAMYPGATIERMQPHQGSGAILMLRHQYRWLLYNSTGEIIDAAGAEDPVTINDPATGFGLYDLDSLEWLATGQFYRVNGCEFAYERRDAP